MLTPSRFPYLRRLGLLLPTVLVVLSPLAVAAAPLPTPTPQKSIVLIQLDGSPVTGVTVHLLAPNVTPRQGVTDSGGGVAFSDLTGFWTVTFSGLVQGQPIQPPADQGLPPYGTNTSGGGFLVQVEAQDEGAAPTPVVVAGLVQAEIQISRFVLLPTPSGWAVTWDLAGAAGPPLPYTEITLGLPTTPTPAPEMVAPRSAAPATVDPPTNLALLGLLVAGALLLGGGLYAVYLRRQERQARAAAARRDL